MTPIQTQLEEAREELELREMEVRQKRRAYAIAESLRDGAEERFNQLRAQELLAERERLMEARRQNSEEAPHLLAGEDMAYPNGRAAAI